jgi:peptide/nickel transport system substrate-binding protein
MMKVRHENSSNEFNKTNDRRKTMKKYYSLNMWNSKILSAAFVVSFAFFMTLFITLPSVTLEASSKYVIGWNSAPSAGMNPVNVNDHSDFVFLPFLYDPLLIHTLTGDNMPWLAKSVTYNSSNDTWVVKLRENANWHDGKPVTAEDLKFTLETCWKYNAVIGDGSKAFVESITVQDPKTAVFKLKRKLAAFEMVIGRVTPIPKHIWSSLGDITKFTNPTPVGSGPFKFREYKQGAFLAMTANKDHWRGAPAMDELIIRVFANVQAQVVALKKGEVDFLPDLTGNENLLRVLETDKNIKVHMGVSNNIFYVALNYHFDIMKNKTFRQALDLTIPKEKIVKVALAGRGSLPLMGYIPPVVEKWSNKKVVWAAQNMSEDDRFKKANQLLDGLGWKKGSDGIRVTDAGQRLEFSIKTRNDPTYVRTGEMILHNWEKIGVKLKLEVHEARTVYPGIVYNGKDTKDWQFFIHRSVMKSDPDNYAQEYAPDGDSFWINSNAFGWKHAEAQGLLKASRGEMDEAKRIQMIMKVQELFADDLAVLSMAHKETGFAYRTDKYINTNTVKVYTSYIAIANVAAMKAK